MAFKEQERVILGGWLLGFHLEDMDTLKAEDFATYRDIASLMFKGERDPFTIAKASGIKLAELSYFTTEYADRFYSVAVKTLLKNRLALRIANVTVETDMNKLLTEMEEYQNYGYPVLPKHAENLGQLLITDLDERAKQETVSIGIPGMDKLMNGLRRKELTVIGARPSVGKSAFGLQVTRRLAEQNKKVLHFPLEMSVESNLARLAMHNLDIDASKMLTGKLSRDDWKELSPEISEINALGENIYFYEAVNEIEKIIGLVDQEKPFAIVIDQLEQLRSSTQHFKDKRERFSYMTNTLQNIAMTRDVSVILLCQVSRSAQETEPTMANLKESGSIEEDADKVILLHRIPEKEIENPAEWEGGLRPVVMKLEKNRFGGIGYVVTAFMPNKCKFVEVAR